MQRAILKRFMPFMKSIRVRIVKAISACFSHLCLEWSKSRRLQQLFRALNSLFHLEMLIKIWSSILFGSSLCLAINLLRRILLQLLLRVLRTNIQRVEPGLIRRIQRRIMLRQLLALEILLD